MNLPLMICGAILLAGCAEVELPNTPSPYYGPGSPCQPTVVCNTPNNPPNSNNPIIRDIIELRVNGNATSARIRHSNSNDGLSQITTTLPFILRFDSTSPSLFLTLEATPAGYSALTMFPFLSVQIFANGSLFREATSTDFFLSTISVSGTWR